MRKLLEILRLGLENGLSHREIAHSVSIGKTKVQKVLERAKTKEIKWDQIKNCSEEDLNIILFPEKQLAKPKKVELDFVSIKTALLKKEVTLKFLWMDYKSENPNGVEYSHYCKMYRAWKKRSRLSMRQEHIAGDKAFLDFTGSTVLWFDKENNIMRKAEIFVIVLGASNYTYVKAVSEQGSSSWIHCNIDAFEFFGGVPKILVPDNLKAAITKAHRYDPDINEAYSAMAQHYGTAIMPARPYKPKDKAKAEVAVQVVQRWIIVHLKNMTFYSVEEINRAIKPLNEELNNKIMRHLKVSRKHLFENYERAVLGPLPAQPFEIPVWKKAKVNIDYHVEMEGHYYSVPYTLIGEKIEVKLTRSLVEMILNNKKVAVHKRNFTSGSKTTLSEHQPPQHSFFSKWNPENIMHEAKSMGINIFDFCNAIIQDRKNIEVGYRACLGVIRLKESYDIERINAACAMALKTKIFTLDYITRLLKMGISLKSAKKPNTPTTPVLNHENIRGSEYYKN